jgi:hypothetical protein
MGTRNRVVVPARQPMEPGGLVGQPYSYSFANPPIDCSKIRASSHKARCSGIFKQSMGARNRVVVPARQPMWPDGPVLQPYSYLIPSPP